MDKGIPAKMIRGYLVIEGGFQDVWAMFYPWPALQ